MDTKEGHSDPAEKKGDKGLQFIDLTEACWSKSDGNEI